MNVVKYALEQIDDRALPVSRDLNAFEINELREIAEKRAKSLPGNVEENIAFELIKEAFGFGFWQGWKHCEAERPSYEDIDDEEIGG